MKHDRDINVARQNKAIREPNKLTIEDFPPELIERLAQRCMELAGIPYKHLDTDKPICPKCGNAFPSFDCTCFFVSPTKNPDISIRTVQEGGWEPTKT